MSASPAPAPVSFPTSVDLWRANLEASPRHVSPCRYLAPARWAAIRESTLDFCNRFGAEAHRLSWTAPELFAVHPEHGTLRLDYCGALMVSGAASVILAQALDRKDSASAEARIAARSTLAALIELLRDAKPSTNTRDLGLGW